jgi:hypothetical protein
MDGMITAEQALRAVTALVSVGTLLASLEFLALPRGLGKGGLLDWSVLALRHRWTVSGWTGRAMERLFAPSWFACLMAGRALASALLIVWGWDGAVRPVLLLLLLVSSLCIHLRSSYGLDGADQMSLFLIACLFGASLGTSAAQAYCLWLIALQASLAYLVSGLAKLLSKDWQKGGALIGVMGTAIYGNQTVYQVMLSRPPLRTLASWLVMVWEAAFPAALLLPAESAAWVLGAGVVFHLSTAVVMGLNTFFWAFVASYPALFFCIGR